MKKIILFLFVTTQFAGNMVAQSLDKGAVQKATDEMAALYGLDSEQAKKMHSIQMRHARNLAEIAVLESQDRSLYLQKKRSARLGMEASVKKMLREEQMAVFREQQLERRKKESEKIKQLRAEGASKEEIQMALLEMG